MSEKVRDINGLRPGFTPWGIWAFSIGTSIGWGSFIVTCNTYNRQDEKFPEKDRLILCRNILLFIVNQISYAL